VSVRVIKGGLLTTVQDEGRTGVYHLGMPPSGAMDKFSYRVANMLVGNAPGAAVLEATYMGPELEVRADTVVAATGADMPMKVDGEEVEPWTSHAVKAGSVVEREREIERRALAHPALDARHAALEAELGDLLFAVVNLCRKAGVHASLALDRANSKFTRRFSEVERIAAERGLVVGEASLEELDGIWDQVKQREAGDGRRATGDD